MKTVYAERVERIIWGMKTSTLENGVLLTKKYQIKPIYKTGKISNLLIKYPNKTSYNLKPNTLNRKVN